MNERKHYREIRLPSAGTEGVTLFTRSTHGVFPLRLSCFEGLIVFDNSSKVLSYPSISFICYLEHKQLKGYIIEILFQNIRHNNPPQKKPILCIQSLRNRFQVQDNNSLKKKCKKQTNKKTSGNPIESKTGKQLSLLTDTMD